MMEQMLLNMIKSVMPPGMTIEHVTAVASQLANRVVAVAQAVERIEAEQAQQTYMLRHIMAACQAGGPATAVAALQSFPQDTLNDDAQQRPCDPGIDSPGIAGTDPDDTPGTGTA